MYYNHVYKKKTEIFDGQVRTNRVDGCSNVV